MNHWMGRGGVYQEQTVYIHRTNGRERFIGIVGPAFHVTRRVFFAFSFVFVFSLPLSNQL